MAAEPQPYTTVILDIEGTTTPITFVHDVLFPYVKDHLQGFLADHWEEAECVSKVHALREQAEKDVAGGLDGAVPILATEGAAAEQVRQSVVDNVRWQMSIDRKIGPLKALQGYMWRSAYESGQIQGAIYDDVVPALDKWTAQGVDIYIYSSGSVEAQKLLFEWSEKGDLLKYFKGHFDTGVGLKIERESYEKIAQTIGRDPATLLFISDNVKEIAAAISANYQVAIAHRPGNAPLPSPAPGGGTVEADFDSITLPDAHDVPVIRSFAEVFTRAAFATSAGQRFKVDDLIHLETMFEELGREDGLRDGVHAGHVEGRVAGTEAGFAMGQEAGFYGGVADTYLKAAEMGLITPSDRALKALQSLRIQAKEFPRQNYTNPDEGPDPTVALDKLRARFKVAVSALGPDALNLRYKPEDGVRQPMNF